MIPSIKKAVFEKYFHKCSRCRSRKFLHIHHIDKNRGNNAIENLLLLCRNCHFKIHGKIPVQKKREKIIDLRRKGMSLGDIARTLKLHKGGVTMLIYKANMVDPTIGQDFWHTHGW